MVDEHLISLQPGTVIAGRYEVVRCLGAGSMGLVYSCHHRELSGHMVAVKVLFPEVARDKIAAARFRNEIFASYGVSHPNVVRAYDYVRDGELVAYAMEYVAGGDLAERMEKHSPLDISEIANILSQLCSGVQAIHDAGIVHRDLKPENILLTNDGMVKIADFGIARTDRGPKLTEHGGVVGTIDYVSPEYMLNSHVDWRSDIYAIGILGYEMITGNSPFRGDSVYATMTKRLKSDPAPPSSLREDCPPQLDRIMLRAMERDPEQRYQSAAEMFYDLQVLVPERKTSSGAYFSMSQRESGAYRGPAVDPKHKEKEKEAAEEQMKPQWYGRKEKPAPYYPDAQMNFSENDGGSRGGAHYMDAGGGMAAAISESGLNSIDRTHVLSSEIVEISSQYQADETVFEPVRMERMLGRNDLVSDGWVNATDRTQVITNSAGLDEHRLRRLSQQVDRRPESTWTEILTLVVALLLGVGIGFIVVRMFFPKFNLLRSSGAAPVVVTAEKVIGLNQIEWRQAL